jgi:predicted AAA+ superfamily ATPase
VQYTLSLHDALPILRHTARLKDLLKLLAFQIGSEVSLTELGQQLSMSKDTVNNYISLLEQAFVLFRLSGFSKNLRNEVTKMDKIYFYDLGIRNILIDNLKPIKDRDDVGKLFENFLITERLKLNSYKKAYANSYFWRIYTGAELDYVEEKEMLLYGYEFKYSKTKASVPKSWIETYKADYKLISKENFLDFIK